VTRSPAGLRCGSASLRHSTAFAVRGFHLRHVMHEQEFAEVVVDACALQMFARTDEFLARAASRPIASCCAARSDHARHQSFHDAMPAVTSSKSVSATPLRRSAAPNARSRT
jgi:hypothetical protein